MPFPIRPRGRGRGRFRRAFWCLPVCGLLTACGADLPETSDPSELPMDFVGAPGEVRLMTLDPGHFHAGLVQKFSYPQVDTIVHVYAPAGSELEAHLALVESFNARAENPTRWKLEVYTGADFVERIFAEKPGNVLVVAGNNGRKIDYVRRAVEEGINVLADKPIIIRNEDFAVLKETLELADEKGLLVNDIMTERHAITSILQRELARIPALFGTLEEGSAEDPAISKESVHFFSKVVAGAPLVRPPWFFDVAQQGEGIVDVSTHLVDLILWQGFPGEAIDYADPGDLVEVITASVAPTPLTLAQFQHVTNTAAFPDYLAPYVENGTLNVPVNGEFIFRARGVHGRVSVRWAYENPVGGDTHFSRMRGTDASLVIRQDAPQSHVATLYVEAPEGADQDALGPAVEQALAMLGDRYPGLSTRPTQFGWEIVIPDSFRESHEDHFTRVTEEYLAALVDGELPEWERTNLVTKYYITTRAYEMSR